jgi:hypothetical protein
MCFCENIDKNKQFKEYCIKRRLDYKLKTTKLPKYIPLPFH